MPLSYQQVGSGTPVVLLHAFPLSSEMWKAQLKNVEGVKIIAPDLSGFSKSAAQNKPSIPDMAKEVAGLLDSLSIKGPVVLCGLSMGGYVAFEFYRQFPKQVRALGLFSTKAAPDTSEGREKRFKTAEAIKEHGLEPFADKMLMTLLGETTQKSKPEIVAEVKRMILSNKKEGVIAALLAMADRGNSADLLQTIHCPTLIIAGSEDVVIPASEAQNMHKQISSSKLCVIEKAGHLINLEQPNIFQDNLDSFLRSL